MNKIKHVFCKVPEAVVVAFLLPFAVLFMGCVELYVLGLASCRYVRDDGPFGRLLDDIQTDVLESMFGNGR